MKMRNWLVIFVALSFIFTFSAGAMADEGSENYDYNMSDMMRDDNEPPCMKAPGMMGKGMTGHGMKHPMMGTAKGMMGMPPMMDRWEDLQSKLELNDEQSEKLRKVYSDYRKEIMKRRVEIEIAEMDLMELLRSKDASDKAIEDASNKIQSAWSALNAARADAGFIGEEHRDALRSHEGPDHLMDWRGS